MFFEFATAGFVDREDDVCYTTITKAKGRTVQVRRGPAAVTRDEIPFMPLGNREGWESRMIWKPEDLPLRVFFSSREGEARSLKW